MWGKDVQDTLDRADANLVTSDVETGFGVNFEATAQNVLASGLSVSRYIMQEPIRERNSRIRDLGNTDPEIAQFRNIKVDPKTGRVTSDYDYDAAADYLVQRGDEGFQSTAELQKQIQESVKQADEYEKLVADKSGIAGVAGSFAAGLATQVIEPVNYVAVIPGIGTAATLSMRAKVAVGAIEAALGSALVQPTMKQWKNENDIEYTTKDMALDVGLSAAFGGALSGLGHWAGDKLKGIRSNKKTATSSNEKAAYDAAEERMAEFEQEIFAAQAIPEADRPKTSGEMFNAMDDTARAMANTQDRWTPPDSPYADLSDEEMILGLEQSLGITRTKPESAEGVDVDTPEVISFEDRNLFTYHDEDGVEHSFADVIEKSDADNKKIEETINCMMGGGNA